MALADPKIQDGLLNHALAILGRRLAHRAVAARMDKAKEARQETCVRALQSNHNHDPTRPVRPWLHGIMNHVLSEIIGPPDGGCVQPPADPTIWQRLVVKPERDGVVIVTIQTDVAVYLARLPPEHRDILQLRFYDDLSHEDIAARLGISNGNARVRLCRALIELKTIAEDRP
jgi:RNA polymerase sigma-70 factor (ECF subfamily)